MAGRRKVIEVTVALMWFWIKIASVLPRIGSFGLYNIVLLFLLTQWSILCEIRGGGTKQGQPQHLNHHEHVISVSSESDFCHSICSLYWSLKNILLSSQQGIRVHAKNIHCIISLPIYTNILFNSRDLSPNDKTVGGSLFLFHNQDDAVEAREGEGERERNISCQLHATQLQNCSITLQNCSLCPYLKLFSCQYCFHPLFSGLSVWGYY